MAFSENLSLPGVGLAPPARGVHDAGRFPSPKDVTGLRFAVCVYEGTGEASAVYLSGSNGHDVQMDDGKFLDRVSGFVDEWGELDEAALIEDGLRRQSDNMRRANSRAVAESRRFAVRWGLTKMWTFTFKNAQFDRAYVVREMNDFFQRWRVLNGGRAFPYLYVLELHPKGHGYHVHVAVPDGMFTDFFQLRRVWGHGRIRFDKAKRHHGHARDDARRLASYLVKYLVKSIDEHHERGQHRYERAEGFDVKVIRRYFPSLREVRLYLSDRVENESFVEVWSDYEVERWRGPPTWLFMSRGARAGVVAASA